MPASIRWSAVVLGGAVSVALTAPAAQAAPSEIAPSEIALAETAPSQSSQAPGGTAQARIARLSADLTQTSHSGRLVSYTAMVGATGGTARGTSLYLIAERPLKWSGDFGCAELDSGHRLRCALGDLAGTENLHVSAQAPRTPTSTANAPRIIAVATAVNAEQASATATPPCTCAGPAKSKNPSTQVPSPPNGTGAPEKPKKSKKHNPPGKSDEELGKHGRPTVEATPSSGSPPKSTPKSRPKTKAKAETGIGPSKSGTGDVPALEPEEELQPPAAPGSGTTPGSGTMPGSGTAPGSGSAPDSGSGSHSGSGSGSASGPDGAVPEPVFPSGGATPGPQGPGPQGQLPVAPPGGVPPVPPGSGTMLPPVNGSPRAPELASPRPGAMAGRDEMTLYSPAGLDEEGAGADWARVLAIVLVSELALVWLAACLGLWRRRLALERRAGRGASIGARE